MADYKDLEFLAEKAKELLDRQIDSYRTNHTKAGTIIGISSVFIPIFLFLIENSSTLIQILSFIPILGFLYSIILMINILRSRPLDQGFNQHQFDKLVNQDYESILLYEIGAKKDSISDNEKITKKQNNKFNRGLIITVISLFISISILIANQTINNYVMTEENQSPKTETKKDTSPDVSKTKDRVIPNVPKKDRIQLNEGHETKTSGNKNSE